MDRRQCIRIVGSGVVGTVLFPGLLTGCQSSDEQLITGQQYLRQQQNDVRLLLISYGMLAANPHNIQPWLVRFDGPHAMELYVDPERLLPKTDPFHRQIHIGQGTFIENLTLAAAHFGYHCDLDYFPEGRYGTDELKNWPVARITLVEEAAPKTDPLFQQLIARQSTKTLFEPDRPVTAALIDQLQRSVSLPDGFMLRFSQQTALKQSLSNIIRDAMAIEVSDEQRHLETWRMFRFSEDELIRKRDGFGYASNGITGIKRFFAERMYSRARAKPVDSSWARFPVQQHYEMANSASAFGWILSQNNERLDQLLAGRLYERINLKASELGLAMHPHSQVLQEYSDMHSLQQHFLQQLNVPDGYRVQMLYRLGYAAAVEHTPRRFPESIVMD